MLTPKDVIDQLLKLPSAQFIIPAEHFLGDLVRTAASFVQKQHQKMEAQASLKGKLPPFMRAGRSDKLISEDLLDKEDAINKPTGPGR